MEKLIAKKTKPERVSIDVARFHHQLKALRQQVKELCGTTSELQRESGEAIRLVTAVRNTVVQLDVRRQKAAKSVRKWCTEHMDQGEGAAREAEAQWIEATETPLCMPAEWEAWQQWNAKPVETRGVQPAEERLTPTQARIVLRNLRNYLGLSGSERDAEITSDVQIGQLRTRAAARMYRMISAKEFEEFKVVRQAALYHGDIHRFMVMLNARGRQRAKAAPPATYEGADGERHACTTNAHQRQAVAEKAKEMYGRELPNSPLHDIIDTVEEGNGIRRYQFKHPRDIVNEKKRELVRALGNLRSITWGDGHAPSELANVAMREDLRGDWMFRGPRNTEPGPSGFKTVIFGYLSSKWRDLYRNECALVQATAHTPIGLELTSIAALSKDDGGTRYIQLIEELWKLIDHLTEIPVTEAAELQDGVSEHNVAYSKGKSTSDVVDVLNLFLADAHRQGNAAGVFLYDYTKFFDTMPWALVEATKRLRGVPESRLRGRHNFYEKCTHQVVSPWGISDTFQRLAKTLLQGSKTSPMDAKWALEILTRGADTVAGAYITEAGVSLRHKDYCDDSTHFLSSWESTVTRFKALSNALLTVGLGLKPAATALYTNFGDTHLKIPQIKMWNAWKGKVERLEVPVHGPDVQWKILGVVRSINKAFGRETRPIYGTVASIYRRLESTGASKEECLKAAMIQVIPMAMYATLATLPTTQEWRKLDTVLLGRLRKTSGACMVTTRGRFSANRDDGGMGLTPFLAEACGRIAMELLSNLNSDSETGELWRDEYEALRNAGERGTYDPSEEERHSPVACALGILNEMGYYLGDGRSPTEARVLARLGRRLGGSMIAAHGKREDKQATEAKRLGSFGEDATDLARQRRRIRQGTAEWDDIPTLRCTEPERRDIIVREWQRARHQGPKDFEAILNMLGVTGEMARGCRARANDGHPESGNDRGVVENVGVEASIFDTGTDTTLARLIYGSHTPTDRAIAWDGGHDPSTGISTVSVITSGSAEDLTEEGGWIPNVLGRHAWQMPTHIGSKRTGIAEAEHAGGIAATCKADIRSGAPGVGDRQGTFQLLNRAHGDAEGTSQTRTSSLRDIGRDRTSIPLTVLAYGVAACVTRAARGETDRQQGRQGPAAGPDRVEQEAWQRRSEVWRAGIRSGADAGTKLHTRKYGNRIWVDVMSHQKEGAPKPDAGIVAMNVAADEEASRLLRNHTTGTTIEAMQALRFSLSHKGVQITVDAAWYIRDWAGEQALSHWGERDRQGAVVRSLLNLHRPLVLSKAQSKGQAQNSVTKATADMHGREALTHYDIHNTWTQLTYMDREAKKVAASRESVIAHRVGWHAGAEDEPEAWYAPGKTWGTRCVLEEQCRGRGNLRHICVTCPRFGQVREALFKKVEKSLDDLLILGAQRSGDRRERRTALVKLAVPGWITVRCTWPDCDATWTGPRQSGTGIWCAGVRESRRGNQVDNRQCGANTWACRAEHGPLGDPREADEGGNSGLGEEEQHPGGFFRFARNAITCATCRVKAGTGRICDICGIGHKGTNDSQPCAGGCGVFLCTTHFASEIRAVPAHASGDDGKPLCPMCATWLQGTGIEHRDQNYPDGYVEDEVEGGEGELSCGLGKNPWHERASSGEYSASALRINYNKFAESGDIARAGEWLRATEEIAFLTADTPPTGPGGVVTRPTLARTAWR